jgi:hypothetical protein
MIEEMEGRRIDSKTRGEGVLVSGGGKRLRAVRASEVREKSDGWRARGTLVSSAIDVP